jgi:hypothetical protein
LGWHSIIVMANGLGDCFCLNQVVWRTNNTKDLNPFGEDLDY